MHLITHLNNIIFYWAIYARGMKGESVMSNWSLVDEVTAPCDTFSRLKEIKCQSSALHLDASEAVWAAWLRVWLCTWPELGRYKTAHKVRCHRDMGASDGRLFLGERKLQHTLRMIRYPDNQPATGLWSAEETEVLLCQTQSLSLTWSKVWLQVHAHACWCGVTWHHVSQSATQVTQGTHRNYWHFHHLFFGFSTRKFNLKLYLWICELWLFFVEFSYIFVL